MEINVVELIVQAGGLGLAALLVFLVMKYGGAYLDQLTSRLLDNLDQQAENYRANIAVQVQLEASLRSLCEKLDGYEDGRSAQAQETADTQVEVARILNEMSKRLAAHETRAQRRHDQQMGQSAERHAELIGVLQGLNGKS